MVLTLVTALAVSAVPTASYEAAPAAVAFDLRRQAFAPLSRDTGWQPPAGPVQVRVVAHVGSGAAVRAPGAVRATWGGARTLAVEGTPNGGVFALDVGVELDVYLRLTLKVPAGPTYQWEGLLPGAPNFDYRFAAAGTFTPFLLAGQVPGTVSVTDSIQPTLLYRVPLTQALIPIPGIGGYLDLSAGGTLSAQGRGLRVRFNQDDLTVHGGTVPWTLPELTTLTRQATYAMEARVAGALELVPQVTVQIGPAKWQLASLTVPVPLPARTEVWESAPVETRFELPRLHVEVDGAPVALDAARTAAVSFSEGAIGEKSVRALRLSNTGTAPLEGKFELTGEGFRLSTDVTEWTLPAGASRVASVELERVGAGTFAGALVLHVGDPAGDVTLTLDGSSVVAEGAGPTASGPGDDPRAGTLRDVGCGCTSGAEAAWALPFALFVFFRRRR